MLKKIWLDIQQLDSSQEARLKTELAQSQLMLEIKQTEAMYAGRDVLLITDRQESVQRAADLQIPCIAYLGSRAGEALFGTSYGIEELSGEDVPYFEEVFCRVKGLPRYIFETKRCRVREILVDDLERLYEIYADKEVTRFIEDLYQDREEEKNYTSAYINNMYAFYGYGLWIVEEKSTGSIIGRAGLENREVDGQMLTELGYVIAADYQRKGYGYEVCKKILQYAFEQLEMKRVYCFMNGANIPSVKLAIKLGFQYQGICMQEEHPLCCYMLEKL